MIEPRNDQEGFSAGDLVRIGTYLPATDNLYVITRLWYDEDGAMRLETRPVKNVPVFLDPGHVTKVPWKTLEGRLEC